MTSPKIGYKQKKILIAPLNWGLGHASRCIVVVNFLLENNFIPVIASDGDALVFFKKEFPELETVELPSYGIKYSKQGFFLKWKLFLSLFSISIAVNKEKQIVAELVSSGDYVGLISDNRFGVFSEKIPSVYLTHQVNVLSGVTTSLTTWVHQRIISKFKECWVPDAEVGKSLAGNLSASPQKNNISIKYIGNLSRLQRGYLPKKYELLVLLSGPEPQRTLLENKLLGELESYNGNVAFVRGQISPRKKLLLSENIIVFDFLLSKELEVLINQSETVIARSGYSTIMDLSELNKKAFFIPTPGQSEQQYLAEYLEEKNIAPFSDQYNFDVSLLEKTASYSGFIGNSNESLLKKELLEVFNIKV